VAYNCFHERTRIEIPPPLVALFLAILMWFTPALAGSVAIPSSLRIGLALAVFGLGQGVAVSGVVAFRRARTTLNPIKASSASALVRSGVFRFTRNPMYLGLLLALFAWAVFLSNPMTLLFLPVYVLYINRFQITPEERVLTSLFGTEYPAYKKKCSPLAVKVEVKGRVLVIWPSLGSHMTRTPFHRHDWSLVLSQRVIHR
jgi:protein-S-isoprenylcysteine O-methyltransferase Ste14